MKYILFLLISFAALGQEYSRRELNRLELDKYSGHVHNDLKDNWAEFYSRRNLKDDSNKTMNNWETVFPIKEFKTQRVEGKRKYYGLFAKKYNFSLVQDPDRNKIIIQLKLHFYESKSYKKYSKKLEETNDDKSEEFPTTERLFQNIARELVYVQFYWNSMAPQNVAFQFDIVEDPKLADYSIKLTTKQGGVYDSYMQANIDQRVLAHEIGHMLGIDDEYVALTGNVLKLHERLDKFLHKSQNEGMSRQKDLKCNMESLMCNGLHLYPYHYEQILRKIEL